MYYEFWHRKLIFIEDLLVPGIHLDILHEIDKLL